MIFLAIEISNAQTVDMQHVARIKLTICVYLHISRLCVSHNSLLDVDNEEMKIQLFSRD